MSQDNSLLVGAICLHLPAGTWDCAGTRGDFILGCLASFAACTDCWVDPQRLFKPHFLVRAAFDLGRQSARVVKHSTCTRFGLQVGSLLWMNLRHRGTGRFKMFWLSMRRGCGSWAPKMFRLFPVLRLVILLVPGWPERVLADACTLAGGPLPMEGALRLGRGRLDAYRVPVLRMRRRLKICLDIAGALVTHGFSVFRAQELSVRWQVVLDQGPVGPLVQVAYLGSGGLQEIPHLGCHFV